eukprot:1346305-Amorphochlora_amoeboformis.AAC.1
MSEEGKGSDREQDSIETRGLTDEVRKRRALYIGRARSSRVWSFDFSPPHRSLEVDKEIRPDRVSRELILADECVLADPLPQGGYIGILAEHGTGYRGCSYIPLCQYIIGAILVGGCALSLYGDIVAIAEG